MISEENVYKDFAFPPLSAAMELVDLKSSLSALCAQVS